MEKLLKELLEGQKQVIKEITGLKQDMVEVKGRLGNVEGKLGDVDGRLGNVEGKLGDVDGRLGNVAGRLEVTFDQVGKNTEMLTEILENIDYLKYKESEHERQLYILNKKVK